MKRGAVTTSVTINRHFSLFVSGNRSLTDHRWFTGGFAGLGVNIGPRDMVNVSAERDSGISRQSVDLQRTLPVGTGIGYHVQGITGTAGTTGTPDLDAELRAQTQYGKYAIRQTVFDGQPSTMADASGALVFIGGGVHFTRPVENGFALVQVPDVRGVRTYVSNQEVGRTDRHGNLVVPNLLSYYANRVSIDDADVPMDRDVPRDAMLLAPPYRGGAIALFPAPRPWRVAGRFVVLRDRTVITPSNWALSIATPSGPLTTALGGDGAFYVEGVAPGDHRADCRGWLPASSRCSSPRRSIPPVSVHGVAARAEEDDEDVPCRGALLWGLRANRGRLHDPTTAVSFGTYDVFNASATTSTGTVQVRQRGSQHHAISRSSGTFANRQ
jgi:outer membrane usher protein